MPSLVLHTCLRYHFNLTPQSLIWTISSHLHKLLIRSLWGKPRTSCMSFRITLVLVGTLHVVKVWHIDSWCTCVCLLQHVNLAVCIYVNHQVLLPHYFPFLSGVNMTLWNFSLVYVYSCSVPKLAADNSISFCVFVPSWAVVFAPPAAAEGISAPVMADWSSSRRVRLRVSIALSCPLW